jgi:hypothetical protein
MKKMVLNFLSCLLVLFVVGPPLLLMIAVVGRYLCPTEEVPCATATVGWGFPHPAAVLKKVAESVDGEIRNWGMDRKVPALQQYVRLCQPEDCARFARWAKANRPPGLTGDAEAEFVTALDIVEYRASQK